MSGRLQSDCKSCAEGYDSQNQKAATKCGFLKRSYDQELGKKYRRMALVAAYQLGG